jgi:hypothetical protein
MSHDYIPEASRKFLVWVEQLIHTVQANAEAFGLKTESFAHLLVLLDAYKKAFARREGTNSGRVDTQAKVDAGKALKSAVRTFVGEYLIRNHLISNEYRDLLGLPIYKKTHTPSPVAEDAPRMNVDSSVLCRLTIHFYPLGSRRRRGKPHGQQCVELVYIISEERPLQWGDMPHSVTDTNSPIHLVFDYSMRGKRIWFALRWQNTRGKKGPWTDIHMAIIP